jgi:hypothetical protein
MILHVLQIECALDEWKTGEEHHVVFSEIKYKDTFERHLATLKEWEKRVPELMRSIREDLIENAR